MHESQMALFRPDKIYMKLMQRSAIYMYKEGLYNCERAYTVHMLDNIVLKSVHSKKLVFEKVIWHDSWPISSMHADHNTWPDTVFVQKNV